MKVMVKVTMTYEGNDGGNYGGNDGGNDDV